MKKILLFNVIVFYSLISFSQTPATALNFDGIDDYVNLTNQTQAFNYNSSSVFTIEFWIKPSDKITSQTIIGKGSRTAGKGYIIRVVNNQISFRNRDVIIGGVNTAISPTAWSHVAVTYNATAVKIYINGVLKQTGTLAITPHAGNAPHKMFIGARRADNGNSDTRQRHFKGTLDDLRFWSVERTGSEIMSSKDCALTGSETNLVSYFKFDQGFNNQNNSTQTTLINY
ncbi:LamG domain-containing protein [Olleya aquimaris]|uniref:Concanavalin A-like lectin/glucanase superfamily protein n=1 Tax=Olleya aquimaris TaxID=639310 RepID=A0A327RPT6_9FLAO|nr:LamG domain-containing protein [Olleya aquimaris]RAJ17962.1 concanavalin A-like lectin/glucanase superfamily protein [Olleya aquimaris]